MFRTKPNALTQVTTALSEREDPTTYLVVKCTHSATDKMGAALDCNHNDHAVQIISVTRSMCLQELDEEDKKPRKKKKDKDSSQEVSDAGDEWNKIKG